MAWSKSNKDTGVWGKSNKDTGSWSKTVKDFVARTFLLKEDTDFLLLETGDKIIIEPDGSVAWSITSKDT